VKIVERQLDGYEKILLGVDESIEYRGVIVIHSTRLGPAAGGIRFWKYAGEDAAVEDALRLARGMTYKNALAGLPLGGGKSIIIACADTGDREVLLRAHGKFIDSLEGRYLGAIDLGTTPSDMEHVRAETDYVYCLPGQGVDPSSQTAQGVLYAMRAAARHRWGSDDLQGKKVAIQGCGSVGYRLAQELHRAGAQLVCSDLDEERLRRVGEELGAELVDSDAIVDAEADVFAPCALGGILNDDTIPRLRCDLVVGAANNQLLAPVHGDLLEEVNILYAPDYVANAGGVINGCIEILGWRREDVMRRIAEIYDTLLVVFEAAKRAGISTSRAADLLAEERLAVKAAASRPSELPPAGADPEG
jgi:leucine dehydrogenase